MEWLTYWQSRLDAPAVDADDEDAADMLRHDFDDSAKLLTGPRDVWIVDGGLQVRTVAHVACAFGVSERTIAGWLARGCPGRPGCYDLPAVYKWAKRNVRLRVGEYE